MVPTFYCLLNHKTWTYDCDIALLIQVFIFIYFIFGHFNDQYIDMNFMCSSYTLFE